MTRERTIEILRKMIEQWDNDARTLRSDVQRAWAAEVAQALRAALWVFGVEDA